MIGKPGFVVGFIRTWGARYPITEQRKKMDNHEISRVYDDFDLLIRQRRARAWVRSDAQSAEGQALIWHKTTPRHARSSAIVRWGKR